MDVPENRLMATSTSFKQECPICEALVPIRDPKLIGKKIKCPKCEGTFVVKEPPEVEDEKEEAVTTKPGKKTKPGSNGKVTDKKPGKADGKKGKGDKGEDGDAPTGKKKKKKAGTNMTLVGGGLAVVAVAALGIGGYFFWFKDSKPKAPKGGQPQTQGPQVPGPKPKDPNAKGDDPKGKPNQEKSDLVELTSLLPSDATAVFSVNVEQLRTSGVWAAAIQPPKGPFSEASFLKVFGFPFFSDTGGVARVVTAVKGKSDWVFSAIRTLHEIDQDDLIKQLRLEKQEVNGQSYYLIRRQFDSLGNLLFKANRPRIEFALHFADAKTFVVADTDEIKRYLQNRPKVEDASVKKKETIAPYQNFNPDLKDLLEKVEKGDTPALICMAGDVDTILAAFEPMLGGVVRQGANQLYDLIAKAAAGLPNPLNLEGFADGVKMARNNADNAIKKAEALIREEGKNAAVAVTAFTSDKLSVVVALEMKNINTASTWNGQFIKPLIDWWVSTIGMAAGAVAPPGTKMDKKDAPVTVTVSGKVLAVSYTADIKSEYNRFTAELNKAMIQVRSDADLVNTAPRYHQLAAALTDYVKRTGHFPRGTFARKDNGIDYRRPEDRVSWMAELLPDLPEASFGNVKIDPDKEWYTGGNLAAAQMVVPHFVVRGVGTAFKSTFPSPTRPEEEEYGVTHFVGMAGLGLDAATDECLPDKIGIFGYNRVTKLTDISKGRQDKVIALIQVPPAFRSPWIVGGGADGARRCRRRKRDRLRPAVRFRRVQGREGHHCDHGRWQSAFHSCEHRSGTVSFVVYDQGAGENRRLRETGAPGAGRRSDRQGDSG